MLDFKLVYNFLINDAFGKNEVEAFQKIPPVVKSLTPVHHKTPNAIFIKSFKKVHLEYLKRFFINQIKDLQFIFVLSLSRIFKF